jgi:hypothetical protein
LLQPSPWPAERITAAQTIPLAAPTPPLQIRPWEPADGPAIWALLEPVFRAGETFPHDPAITEDDALAALVKQSRAVMVAADAAGFLVGTYYLRPNSLALGAHVANAGYVVTTPSSISSVGIQHHAPGLDPAWAWIWFIDAAAHPVRPCRRSR